MLKRSGRSLLLVGASLLLLTACDPGWAIAARNEDDQPWLIRVNYRDDTRVFRIEPGETIGILASLGDLPQPMRAELLDESCTMVTRTNVPASAGYSMIVIRADRTLEIAEIPADDEVSPRPPPEVRGKCGGLPEIE